MSDGNGNGNVHIETEGRGFSEALERAREGEGDSDAGFGWQIPGVDPYDGEWCLEDLDEKYATCPDATAGTVQEARLVVGEPYRRGPRRGRLREGTLKYQHVRGDRDLEKLREATGWSRMREWNWSPDPFAYGNPQISGVGGGALGQYLPLWPGPVTRQLYWQDYFAMSAKAFEAYNHDPISWRCVHMKQEFALGKGLQARVTYSTGSKAGQTHDKAEGVWSEFWKRNKMDARLDLIARDLSVMGEQFLRYFVKNKLVTIRSLDPASIYDLITDPEDHETVFAYHQQFQTPYQLWAPSASTPTGGVQSPEGPSKPGQSTRFVIRQILPDEIDHYRVNTGAYERRGRSDLFPALGWIKRLRNYLTSHVIKADMLSRIAWDLEVQGNQAAVTQARSAIFPGGQPPQPGAIFGHNASSKLAAINPGSAGGGGSRWDPILDSLVTMVANSIGLPKDWLGFGMTTTRASALVATEPAARSLEDLQGQVEQILHDCFERVVKAAGINDADVEFTFPSIATEDRTAKLEDLSFAEANNWISKQTSASIAAKELGITGYDYEEEQSLVADEWNDAADSEDDPDKPQMTDENGKPIGPKPQKPKQGDGTIRRPMIVASNRQSPKLDPTRSVVGQEDEPGGLLVPFAGPQLDPSAPPGAGGGQGGPPQAGAKPPGAQPTRSGVPADQNPLSAAGAKGIKGALKVKEDGEVTMHVDDLGVLLAQNAEAVVRRMHEARKRPDDPQFQRNSEEYRRQTAAHLAALVREHMEAP